MKSTGQAFKARYGLEGRYKGICRFEMNLNSQQAIRNTLAITRTTLEEVLRSGRNPIEDFLNYVIQEDTEANVQDTRKTYWQRLVLKDCGFDLAKAEAKLREYKGESQKPCDHLGNSWSLCRRVPPLDQKRSCWKS